MGVVFEIKELLDLVLGEGEVFVVLSNQGF